MSVPLTDPHSGYEEFADGFAGHAEASAYNAHYDRPAVLELLGDISGLDVLDAGCGPGFYAEELLARGATVTGFDASPRLVEMATARTGGRGTFRVHDLHEPLDWIPDASFERAVMALVIHYLEDPVPALRELRRVLRAGGRLVLSTHHPMDAWRRHRGSYFADEMVEETWRSGWRVRYRRIPLQTLVEEFQAAGFAIERIVEPRPAPSMEREFPEEFAKLSAVPAFILFSLTKSPGSGPR
ncbi:MAG: class I SAM-dependent methyltransferase [bacterium]|nr:class I SAM-dependent methyltransferase [bacterium]